MYSQVLNPYILSMRDPLQDYFDKLIAIDELGVWCEVPRVLCGLFQTDK
jgi:hypothetical protein